MTLYTGRIPTPAPELADEAVRPAAELDVGA
jgi:hypothetical protein